LLPLYYAFEEEELGHLGSLVALDLDDVPEFFILDDGAVAVEILLEGLQNLLVVELVRDALDGRQTLLTVSLLVTDVDVALLAATGAASIEVLPKVGCQASDPATDVRDVHHDDNKAQQV